MGGVFTERLFTEEKCIKLLKDKQEELKNGGFDRFPQRSDFSDEEVCAVKAFLGPWPRALEKAGLKEPRDDDRKLKTVEKRIRAKRKMIQAKKLNKNNSKIKEIVENEKSF